MEQDLAGLLAALRRLPGHAKLDGHALLAAAFPNLRYVWLRRADKLRQAVSWERAAQTGVWSNTGEPLPIVVPRPRFDRDAIQVRLDEIERGEADWQELFDRAGVKPVQVGFDELAADYEGTARRVLAELRIEAPADLWFAPRRLRLMSDAVNERWAERFLGSRAAHAVTRQVREPFEHPRADDSHVVALRDGPSAPRTDAGLVPVLVHAAHQLAEMLDRGSATMSEEARRLAHGGLGNLDQRLDVDEVGVLVVQEVGVPAPAGRDDRHTGRHRLEQRAAEALARAGRTKQSAAR